MAAEGVTDSVAAGGTRRFNHFRFHVPIAHLGPVFGSDRFGTQAEAFARFFGTPRFLIVQTLFVAAWIVANALGVTSFDPYPFILLNLAFSTQAAYAAPLILLAQTRQADRDKAHAEADALHREDIAAAGASWQKLMSEQNVRIVALLEQNTQLTALSRELAERIEQLTREIHRTIVRS